MTMTAIPANTLSASTIPASRRSTVKLGSSSTRDEASGTCERTMALVDLENLCGTADPSAMDCHWAQALVWSVIGDPSAHVVVAFSHFAAKSALPAWKGGRKLMRSGQDGADRALLDVINNEPLVGRFGRVVIASGDAIFAPAVAELVSLGMVVEVIAPERALARSLASEATNVITLEQITFDLTFGMAS